MVLEAGLIGCIEDLRAIPEYRDAYLGYFISGFSPGDKIMMPRACSTPVAPASSHPLGIDEALRQTPPSAVPPGHRVSRAVFFVLARFGPSLEGGVEAGRTVWLTCRRF
jgi:hypothetical protein